MPTVKTTVVVDLDDVPIPGFPLVRRTSPTEAQSFTVQRATGGGFVALPTGELTTISFLSLTSDQAISVRLDGLAGAITLNANATLVLHDIALTTAPTVSNSSGSTATIRGLAAGQ
jgi:hypothetical protein